MDGRKELTVYPGMLYMAENTFINMKNTSFDLTADVEVEGDKNHGVLIAQGGRFGGWTFWVKNGKPAYSYNFLGLELFQVEAQKSIPAGKHTLKVAFDYDAEGGKRGGGGKVELYIDQEKVGEGRVGKTHANVFSLDDTADTGVDTGTPVDETYGEGAMNAFTGQLQKVRIQIR
jgi:arylsulfatase